MDVPQNVCKINKNSGIYQTDSGIYRLHIAVVKLDGGDLVFMSADERHYGIAFRSRIHVGFDAAQGVERRGARLVEVTVALGYVVDCFLAELSLAQDEGIDAEVGDGVVRHDDVRRYVAGHAASALDEYPVSEFHALMHDGGARKDCEVADLDRTCDLYGVAQHHVVADLAVMANVGLSHDEAVIADAGSFILIDAPVDDNMFTDDVVVADGDERGLSFPSEVLWRGGYDTTLEELVVLADACAVQNRDMRAHYTTVADNCVLVDVGESHNRDIVADLCFGMHVGKGTDR